MPLLHDAMISDLIADQKSVTNVNDAGWQFQNTADEFVKILPGSFQGIRNEGKKSVIKMQVQCQERRYSNPGSLIKSNTAAVKD